MAPLAVAGVAVAQTLAPPGPVPGPSLRVTAADLRQLGGDLQLRVSFSRAVPVAELDAVKGRFICLVLDGSSPTRRRVCVSLKAGLPRATIGAIGPDGRAHGRAVDVTGARLLIVDRVLGLQAPASSLGVTVGATVAWQLLVNWKDGSACERASGPQPCRQIVPASGELQLPTYERPPAAFVRDGHLRVLATGDAMIDGVDRILKQRLEKRRGATVRSDAHEATGLSQSFTPDWVQRTSDQARELQPDVTAMFIGANDDFPIVTPEGGTAACCAAGGSRSTAGASRR